MLRVIITGRNNTVPQQAFTSSGIQPDAGAAADLRRSIPKGRTRTVLRSVHPSALQSPVALPPQPTPRGTSLADKVVDVLTVIAGLAVFGMLALFALVMA